MREAIIRPFPAAPVWCEPDTDDSGAVDINDLLTVINGWGCD